MMTWTNTVCGLDFNLKFLWIWGMGVGVRAGVYVYVHLNLNFSKKFGFKCTRKLCSIAYKIKEIKK